MCTMYFKVYDKSGCGGGGGSSGGDVGGGVYVGGGGGLEHKKNHLN